MQNWKMTVKSAGLENAELENDVVTNDIYLVRPLRPAFIHSTNSLSSTTLMIENTRRNILG